EKVDVMVHEYQTDPVKGDLIHVDFFAINMTEEMDVDVQIRIEGEAAGVKEGGTLQQPLFELQVRAKPANIPEEITIDVSHLNIGDTITVADLPKSDDYEIMEEPETGLAVVLAPEAEEEETEVEDVDFSAEPELVGAEDEEEEEQE